MSDNQLRRVGRPVGTVRREPGRLSTVHIPERVRAWASGRMSIVTMVSDAPKWFTRMEEQAEELAELREGISKKDALIRRLSDENAELLRFKNKALERMAAGEKQLPRFDKSAFQ